MSAQIRNEPPVFLSVAEAALRLGVNASTVRKWIHDGHLKAARPGGELGSLRIPASELERLERLG
jgi:excisionase family DNA binding protein